MAEQAPWQRPGPVAEALGQLVVVLADNKYFFGRRVSEWATGAPELESAVACAAMAQEELGHSRALYPLLHELALANPPVPLEGEHDRERRYCLEFLDAPWQSWTEAVAGMALVDTALVTLLQALQRSAHEELARRAQRVLAEERFHQVFIEGRVRAVAAQGGASLLQEPVDRLLPEVLCWFGPPGEPGVEALRQAGVLDADNEALRQAYLSRVVPQLEEAGLRLGVRRDGPAGRWEYDELPWAGWNRLQRRLTRAASSSGRP